MITGYDRHFNSHAPCGARLHNVEALFLEVNFNSHAPCGARRFAPVNVCSMPVFQLTRPVWGATPVIVCALLDFRISTHTPRVGRDRRDGVFPVGELNFNSHAPCGARQNGYYTIPDDEKFQLTRPVWGATVSVSTITQGTVSFQLTRPVWGATNGSLLTPWRR